MIRQLILLTLAVPFAVPTFALEPTSAERLREDFLS